MLRADLDEIWLFVHVKKNALTVAFLARNSDTHLGAAFQVQNVDYNFIFWLLLPPLLYEDAAVSFFLGHCWRATRVFEPVAARAPRAAVC